MRFYCYSKCSTCKKAYKYLKEKGVEIEEFEIKENPFTDEEIKDLHQKSGQPLKKLFNTSGNVYRDLNLKDRLDSLTNEEAYKLLASNGMLIKRPVLITESNVLFGYKQLEYEKALSHVN